MNGNFHSFIWRIYVILALFGPHLLYAAGCPQIPNYCCQCLNSIILEDDGGIIHSISGVF